MSTRPTLSPADIAAFEPEAKIGLLATLDAAERPHLTLITSLRAKSPTELLWGQFTEGRSKSQIRQDPRAGFLVMNAARTIWRGKARWSHCASEGGDYVLFNQQPMFRYNSYLGIHTVHYMDLVALAPKAQMSLPRLAGGLVLTAVLGPRARTAAPVPALNSWAHRHLSRATTLCFAAYRDRDGFPTIVPLLGCRAIDTGRLAFVPTAHREELRTLAPGSQLAVLALNLEMESVLVRGTLAGYSTHWGVPVGVVELDWVYNSMPPLPGPVYPRVPLRPVHSFR